MLSAARRAADSVMVLRAGPTGISEYDPLVLATDAGQTALFPTAETSKARDSVTAMEDGELSTDGAVVVVNHDAERTTLPVLTDGPLVVGTRRVFGPYGRLDPLDSTAYQFYSLDRDVSATADAGLVGRGRYDATADNPVADVWRHTQETDDNPIAVVNANDADDHQRADRAPLAGSPMSVLGGVTVAAEHLGTTEAIIRIAETDTKLQTHLREAIDTAAGELSVVPVVVIGSDEYRAGKPTATLETIEGVDKTEPRLRPPTPAECRFYGRPTVIHTPRTFAWVRLTPTNPEGTDRDTASMMRLLTVTGDVAVSVTIGVDSDTRLSTTRNAVELKGLFKMVRVGGMFSDLTRALDVESTAVELTAVGLGTEGVVKLLNDERCAVTIARERVRFASETNNGRYVPGWEETVQLAGLLQAVY